LALYMKTPDGRREGSIVELWQAVVQHLNVSFEFRQFKNLEHLLDALEQGETEKEIGWLYPKNSTF
jgi:membrane-bound lytic murein transglycosylase MltF